MKIILHVIDSVEPGGAEIAFMDLADLLRDRGYRSIVVVSGPGWVLDEATRRGLNPIILEAKGSFNISFLLGLLRIVWRERVDLIQSHLLGANVYCALAGWITCTPVVGTFHGMVDVSATERFRRVKFWAMERGIKRYVTVSEALTRSIAQQSLLNLAKTEVVYNGIESARFKRASAGLLRQRLGLQSDATLALSVGNLHPAKGYEILIRAAALLISTNSKLHFVIAGGIKPDLMSALAGLMKALNMEGHCHFIGYVDDTAKLYPEADVFVLSSISEGFSIATLEAMAAGLPMVVTRCGGPQEIVTHEVNAVMVEPGDPVALASGIDRVLSDPAFARRIAAAAREVVDDRFDGKSMIANYERIYAQLLPNPHR